MPEYRSSTRPYPWDEPHVDGLTVEDVDGDGRILNMRIPDPHGSYKKCEKDPRLMVPREPGEFGGEYYRLMPEGTLKNWDGLTVKVNRDVEGLDLNRNFPAFWRQEFEQVGAGPYPTSEPEVRAMVDFVIAHPNIGAGISYHTHSGVILRPMGTHSDDDMIPEDLWSYKRFSAMGEKLTGYPAISIFHDFKYHPKEVITGTQDWLYEHLGALFWTVEIWAPNKEAGITDYKYIDWFRDHPVDDDLKLLKWTDQTHNGRGYVDWYEFDHPELGKVELGGWDRVYTFSNPPPHLMEREVNKFPDWIVFQALMSPKLELRSTSVTCVGDDIWRVEFGVQNVGYLPTDVSRLTRGKKLVRGVMGSISLPEGGALLEGKQRIDAGQLEGRNNYHTLVSFFPGGNASEDRHRFVWLVRAPQGASVVVVAQHERAGLVSSTLVLK